VVAVVVALVFLGFAISAVASKHNRAAGAIVALVAACSCIRLWRSGARVEPDAVVIVGYLMSRRVPWSDIERFEVRPNGQWPYAGFLIRRSSSRPLLISALAAAGRPKSKLDDRRQAVQGSIDELNKVLEESRLTPIGLTDSQRTGTEPQKEPATE
jgi:hypothetical protein